MKMITKKSKTDDNGKDKETQRRHSCLLPANERYTYNNTTKVMSIEKRSNTKRVG